MVRGAYYDQYKPSALPERSRSLDDFLDKVAEELRFTRPVNMRDALQAVCRVLDKHVDDGQIAKVWQSLPTDVRQVATAKLHS